MGYDVTTVDYLPENIGHRYSHHPLCEESSSALYVEQHLEMRIIA